jgi:acyl-CoA reductase-like NAD-dependent aldehyde dehydrogenase
MWLWGARDAIHHRPRGVVGIIGTWNYPIFLNAVSIAQAVTAGNGVLWKPSEIIPTTAELLHQLFLEAGLPRDLIMRLPATRDAGPQLAEADIDHVVFTGSAAVGRSLATRLGQRLISSTLELSGCDAMFVMADADIPMAAKAAWFGATVNRGQTCVATRRVFVQRSIETQFIEHLRPLVESAAPMPLAMEAQIRQSNRLAEEAVAAGASCLTPLGVANSPSLAMPCAILDARPEMSVCCEAPFAPILAVLTFDHLDDALQMNAQCPFALAASVFTRDVTLAESIAERLMVGLVTVNDVVIAVGHPATPFGGQRDSGWGVTQGPDGLLAMTAPQVVSRRGGAFRPHFSAASDDSPMAEFLRGTLAWSHAPTMRDRLAGLWRMVRNARKTLKSS